MKIDISFTNIKHYDISNVGQWAWMFKRKKFVKGFILRFFGIYFNVRETYAMEKLLTLWHARRSS